MEPPRTRYAWNGDVALAYQVLGEGPLDLVYLQGWGSHIDLSWDSPYLSSFLRRLAAGCRLITTDRRGWGCSDRFSPSDVPPFEVMTDDLTTVMDATGADRPVIFASVECAPLAILFAATYPERTSGLILCDPTITYCRTEDTPWVWTPVEWDAWAREVRAEYPLPRWWEGPADHQERVWFERYVRAAISPGALIAEFDRFQMTDIRAVLPTVSAPTLILVGTSGKAEIDPGNGRFAAERIPGAHLVELPDEAPLNWFHWYGRADGVIREVTSFLSDLSHERAALDRVLATVLFTDIVGSTERAAALGDRAWDEVRRQHDAIVRAMIARFRGREIKTMGDGFLVTFDGPARAVRCAQEIASAVGPLGIEIRSGLHTGEITLEDDDVTGLAVSIGARVSAQAGPSEVFVTGTVKDLVAGSGLVFEDAGEHELKGVPDRWRLYRVVG